MNALDWFVGGIVRVWHGLYTQVAIPTPYLAGHTMRQSEVFALAVVGTCAAIAMVTVGRLYRAEECKSESRSQPWSATAATLVFGGLSLGLACFTTWNVLWFGGLRRGPVEFHGIIYYSQNDYVNALLWLVVRHFLLAVAVGMLVFLCWRLWVGAFYRWTTMQRRATVLAYVAGASVLAGFAIALPPV